MCSSDNEDLMRFNESITYSSTEEASSYNVTSFFCCSRYVFSQDDIEVINHQVTTKSKVDKLIDILVSLCSHVSL